MTQFKKGDRVFHTTRKKVGVVIGDHFGDLATGGNGVWVEFPGLSYAADPRLLILVDDILKAFSPATIPLSEYWKTWTTELKPEEPKRHEAKMVDGGVPSSNKLVTHEMPHGAIGIHCTYRLPEKRVVTKEIKLVQDASVAPDWPRPSSVTFSFGQEPPANATNLRVLFDVPEDDADRADKPAFLRKIMDKP